MRILVLSAAIFAGLLTTSAFARIILTATACSAGQHVVLVTIEQKDFRDTGICSNADEPPYRIEFTDGHIETFDVPSKYEERRQQLLSSIKG